MMSFPDKWGEQEGDYKKNWISRRERIGLGLFPLMTRAPTSRPVRKNTLKMKEMSLTIGIIGNHMFY